MAKSYSINFDVCGFAFGVGLRLKIKQQICNQPLLNKQLCQNRTSKPSSIPLRRDG